MPVCARINVYVQPRASSTAVVGMRGDAVHIRVTAPPADNAANGMVVHLIAERLGIAKRQVRVVAGARSRRKVVEIDGATTEVAIANLLASSPSTRGA